jgi:hypothetical protein
LESELETSQTTSNNHISIDEVRTVLKKEIDPQDSNRLASSDRRDKMVKQQTMVKTADVDPNQEIMDNVENFMRSTWDREKSFSVQKIVNAYASKDNKTRIAKMHS